MSVPIELAGRTAWITGGASGIGAAVVGLFERAGARVVSLDCAYAAGGARRWGAEREVALDLRDSEAVAEIVADLVRGGLGPDILVNGAGIARDGVVWNLSDEDWSEVLEVNLTGAFRIVRACCAWMREKGGGAIVNVASINGLRGKFGQANYAASKGGLIALTKTLARELARDGIRVNAIAPGFIDTPMTRRLPPEVRARAEAETLLGRVGHPEDVAAAVLFLASPLAAHITGQVLVVDGGQLV